jgi:hypothetical protein
MNSIPAMRFKRALTKDDLKAIQDRNPDSPDVRALLWEVARLRALALRTHDYFRQGSSSTALILADSLRTMLEDEPAIQEQSKLSSGPWWHQIGEIKKPPQGWLSTRLVGKFQNALEISLSEIFRFA